MVFHFKYSEEQLEKRAKIFGRLSLITFLLLIIVIIYGQTSNVNVGWDIRPTQISQNINDIISINKNEAYAVADSGIILHTINNGTSWQVNTTTTNQDLIAIDYSNGILLVAGKNGTIFAANTTIGNWINRSINSTVQINDISIAAVYNINNFTAYAVGNSGTIWKTTDGGQDWSSQNSKSTVNLNGVDFANSTFGLVVGNNATILGTIDGGQNWDHRTVPNGVTTQNLYDVVFYLQIRIYIVGDSGLFLKSDTNDNPLVSFVWRSWPTGVTTQLNGIYASSRDKLWMVGNNGTILLTQDGGNTFKQQLIPNDAKNFNFKSVTLVLGQYGFVVGEKGIALYTNREGISEGERPKVRNYNDFSIYLEDAFPILFQGFLNMLKIIFLSMILGFTIGVTLAIFRTVDFVPLNVIATIYTDFFRNTPLLVQIFIIHFGLPDIGIDLSFNGLIQRDFISSFLSLGLNSGAYQSEIIRSGIQAIPSGQMEAGRSVGLTYYKSMRYVILPQALRIVIPPLGNEFVNLTLNSSLASITGYQELTRAGRLIIATTFLNFQTWLIVALFYFVITYTLTNLLRYFERRTKIPGLGLGKA